MALEKIDIRLNKLSSEVSQSIALAGLCYFGKC
jgi:hypothetical protein